MLHLHVLDDHVVMDNGILRVTLSKPEGFVTSIKYNQIDNILEIANEEFNRGYWDLVWNLPGSTGTTGTFERISGTDFRVVLETEEQLELSFSRIWDESLNGQSAPLNIDKRWFKMVNRFVVSAPDFESNVIRFIMLRGCPGFYSYAIYEHFHEWPGFILDETRIVFKLRKDKFNYMAMADNRQRVMPLPDDRLPDRGQPLDYPEAVLLVDPIEPEFKGEVDDKYQYSGDNDEVPVHGWICADPAVGFWQIMPSNEFRTGGPLKQDLTSHVGPITLAVRLAHGNSMFVSAHYGGEDLVLKFGEGESWKKVFGPIFMYVNSAAEGDRPFSLWEDAKNQATEQVSKWPYDFPASEDFPVSDQRGIVGGRLLVRDRCVSDDNMAASAAYIGLASPGEAGSWLREGKGYQFWTRTDEEGKFLITNIRCGIYNIYAWIPGFIGDYQYQESITITPGCCIDVGELVYEPPRDSPTLWEIGIPDRSAREFYIPEPNPKYINNLYINHPDRFRQYGLWERYNELYPEDLVYIVGENSFDTDWFFAQVNRKIGEKSYQATTWQIKFQLDEIGATYKLRVALASANQAELQIRVNDSTQNPPLFASGLIGKDNAIARHGIHGLYWLFNVEIPRDVLVRGENTVYLTQANATTPFQGIMYDYIRLEGS